MLDRLPPELLGLVVECAAPLDYSPTTYKKRRTTLRNLSLVCRYLREIAQPMLPEVFVAEPSSLHLLSQPEFGAAVKLLFVSILQPAALATVLGQCPAVVELRVYLSALRVDRLAFLPELRRLTLHQAVLYLPPEITPPTVPLLLELSLSDTKADPANLYQLLDSRFLPSLRAIALEGVKRRTDDCSSWRIDETYGAQLEIFAVDVDAYKECDPSILSLNSLALLVDNFPHLEPEQCSSLHNISLRHFRDYAELRSAASMHDREDVGFFLKQEVKHCLARTGPSLRHLDLPAFLSPDRNRLSPRLSEMRKEVVLDPSWNRGITLSWTPFRDAENEAAESAVPIGLWQAMRRVSRPPQK
ncbi:hypothetical protein JCM11251_000739 [Rhodosporidiobolus azoricus]